MNHHLLFSDKSDLYESARPIYPPELFKYIASLTPSQSLAWDSACGSGQAAIGLVEYFDKVYATDISKEQIKNAKKHPRIDYAVSPSEKTGLENESCDLVCVAQALHWFDHELFWPEVKRVLRPKGIFSVFGYNFPVVNEEIDRIMSAGLFKIIEPYWARQNQLLWNHYRDLEIPFKKIEPPEFQMKTEWNLNEYFNFIYTFSATRRCMDVIGSRFFNEAYEGVLKEWGRPEERKRVDLDFVFYVGVKKM